MGEEQNALQTAEAGGQRTLVTYAVLTGLTPLIPVPVLDDVVKGYFRRRLVRARAAARGRALGEAEVAALSDEGGDGCLRGCVVQALVYPLKKIFRKVFFFLEWKRAADLTSRTYHQGYLLDYALSSPDLLGARSAADLKRAIDSVCREAPIKPLEAAVGAAFRGSKGVVSSAAGLLARAVRGRGGGALRPDREQVAEAVASVEEQEERELAPVTRRLQSAVADIPDEHFRALRARLLEKVGGRQ